MYIHIFIFTDRRTVVAIYLVLVNDRERYLSCIAAWIESMLPIFTFSYQFDIILFAYED